MMRDWLNTRAVITALFLCMATASCGGRYVPLTQDARVRHNLSDQELRGLQYYVSNKIVLRRVMESEERRITGTHKLVVIAGKRVEEIVIEKGTPGVAVAVTPDTITVGFEPGAALVFSLSRDTDAAEVPEGRGGANPFPGNRSDADPDPGPRSSSRSDGVFWLALDRRTNLVPYGGKLYEPVGETMQAHLMVKGESLEQTEETQRVLPGVRLIETPTK